MSDSEFLRILSQHLQQPIRDAIRLSGTEQPDHIACHGFGARVCSVLSAAVQREAIVRRLLRDCERGLISVCPSD